MQGREGLTREVLLDAVRAGGGAEPRTHLSTGNLSFDAMDGASVCAAVATTLSELLGRPTPVLHRTLADLRRIAARLPDEAEGALEHVVVFGPHGGPLPSALDALTTPGHDDHRAAVVLLGRDGDTAWFRRPPLPSPHPAAALERRTGKVLTARSFGSVRHTAAKAG